MSPTNMSRPNTLSFAEVREGCRHMFFLVHSVLREIFDESAYARFLQRHQLATSAEAYSAFLHETEATRQRRSRCC